MASLTIPFPEGTRTLVLRGKRITIGRLPDNTIQMRDRTVSAYHAELIEEGDHFRLHDKGSTNGVVVNGQRVNDFHLHADCKISFGGMVCDFTAAAKDGPQSDADVVPARSEMLAIQQANGNLRAEVTALKQQVEGMRKAREAGDTGGQTVSLEEHDKLLAEITALRGTLQERQTQIERLTSLIAITTRERDSLQKGYDDARAALDKSRKAAAAAASPQSPEAVPAPLAVAAQKKGPGSTVSMAPTAPVAPAAPSAPKATPAPTAPASPSAPAAPRTPVPAGGKPSSAPAVGAPPSAPLAPKPLPKPPVTLGSGSPSRRPASGLQPSAVKAPSAAPTQEPELAAASIGPKGTQKLVE